MYGFQPALELMSVVSMMMSYRTFVLYLVEHGSIMNFGTIEKLTERNLLKLVEKMNFNFVRFDNYFRICIYLPLWVHQAVVGTQSPVDYKVDLL